MLAGLSAIELGRLRMSVGYGTHKKGRPLSPIEVGHLLRKVREEGISLGDCAKAIHLNGTGHVGRFLRILELPADIRHLIDWGNGKGFIGFTSAVELVKLKNIVDQRTVAKAILSDGLSSKEIRQVAQIRERSGRSVEACLKEILNMRPKIEKRYIFVGSASAENIEALGKLTQTARDTILASGIEKLGIQGAAGRLGPKFFALVGDKDFDASVREIGKGNVEAQLRDHISEAVENAVSSR